MVDVGQRCVGTRSGGALAIGAAAKALADSGDVDDARALATLASERSDGPREAYLALLVRAVANLYAGELDESLRVWREIEAREDLPLAYQAEAVMSQAFIACHRGDFAAAREQADRAARLAEASGAPAVRAFALYVVGETVLARDSTEGLRIMQEAAVRARDAHAEQVCLVADVAALSGMVRCGDHDRAVGLAGRLLRRARLQGAWPQVRTTLRIVAELLAHTRPEESVFLLVAADAGTGSQPITGADVPRYAELTDALGQRLGAGVVDRITVLARAASPTQVLDRALSTVADGIDDLGQNLTATPSSVERIIKTDREGLR